MNIDNLFLRYLKILKIESNGYVEYFYGNKSLKIQELTVTRKDAQAEIEQEFEYKNENELIKELSDFKNTTNHLMWLISSTKIFIDSGNRLKLRHPSNRTLYIRDDSENIVFIRDQGEGIKTPFSFQAIVEAVRHLSWLFEGIDYKK